MTAVALDRVVKRYGTETAVADLTMAVEDRELLVILGPSGSGKSTILRLIAGLEEPTEGRILLAGDVVNDVGAKDRDIAMVFQSYALYPHLTVRGNIEFPLRRRRTPKAERDGAVTAAAASLGLTQLLDRKPGALSGGQRQRVALARAVVRQPAVFLMDEPLSNLDAQLRAETRTELVDLHRRLGATFLYVTHDQVEAMTMATRIAVMSDGVLQQLAPPEEVYDRPANTCVARFIGNPPMNIVAARVERSAGGLSAVIGAGRLRLDPLHAAATAGMGTVLVGVRPENLRAGDGPLAAVVRAVESLGHERNVTCELADGQRVTFRQSRDLGCPAAGDAVRLGAGAGHIRLFHPDTSVALNA